ncbi:MAG TPA: hypothetical protein VG269_15865 [Tepidisphaeraceae bacterium]|jgi:hypothetical protein|nr:hypothetical protein [Tepidisphaeraceae bacterium]
MWLDTVEGFVNTNDVLIARVNGNHAEVFPVVAGEYRGYGYPYPLRSLDPVAAMVKGWCDLGEGAFLNVERFSYIIIRKNGASGALSATFYLSDSKLPFADSFDLSPAHMERLKAFLEARTK